MATTQKTSDREQLARENISLAEQIARRLYRRYSWVGRDDLSSYAYIGLALSAKAFDPQRGVPFARFACTKAMYLAIDEMRKDGILSRRDSSRAGRQTAPLDENLPDRAIERPGAAFERRELIGELFKHLRSEERQLLAMIYGGRMAYKDIAKVFGISESAVCLRYKGLMEKLRRQAAVRRAAA